jgi:type IV pilus assembly protein PilE
MVDRRSYAPSLAALGMPAPTSLTGKYTFAVAVVDGPPPAYTISATAVGRQVHDKCGGTSAGLLTLDNAGARSPSDCW